MPLLFGCLIVSLHPNGLIWHARRKMLGVLAGWPRPHKTSQHLPELEDRRGFVAIVALRRAAKGEIRRDRRKQSGKRLVPRPAWALNVELPTPTV